MRNLLKPLGERVARAAAVSVMTLAVIGWAPPTCLAEADGKAADKQIETLRSMTSLAEQLDLAIMHKTETLTLLEMDRGLLGNASSDIRLRINSDRLRRLEERKLDAEERLLRTQHAIDIESETLAKEKTEFLKQWIAALDDKIDSTTAVLDSLQKTYPDLERHRDEINRLRSQRDRIATRMFDYELARVNESAD